MSLSLAIWHQCQNGSRRVPSWVIWAQALGWSLLLARASYAYLWESELRPPPSLYNLIGVALMDAAQVGHMYYLMLAKRGIHYDGQKESTNDELERHCHSGREDVSASSMRDGSDVSRCSSGS